MPRYEYRCRACGDTFERTRPMSESSAPCTCPQGHDDTVKLLSTVAVGGRAGSAAPMARGGGCCGGVRGCGGFPPQGGAGSQVPAQKGGKRPDRGQFFWAAEAPP